MASLSTCHLELVVWDGNLVKSDLSVRDRDKTMSTNMTGREKTSNLLFYPFSELLANENLCIINYVDNGFNEVARGKEGLNLFARWQVTNEMTITKELNTTQRHCRSTGSGERTNHARLRSRRYLDVVKPKEIYKKTNCFVSLSSIYYIIKKIQIETVMFIKHID